MSGQPAPVAYHVSLDVDAWGAVAASLVDRHPTYEIMQWPSFLRSAADRMADRIFVIPEMVFDVFMGDAVKAAFDDAGLTGLQFVTVD